MSIECAKRRLKLRLLAFVIALALAWYIINPAPSSGRRERTAMPPDAGKHQLQAEDEVASLSSNAYTQCRRVATFAVPLDAQGNESFDWPEFIELD